MICKGVHTKHIVEFKYYYGNIDKGQISFMFALLLGLVVATAEKTIAKILEAILGKAFRRKGIAESWSEGDFQITLWAL